MLAAPAARRSTTLASPLISRVARLSSSPSSPRPKMSYTSALFTSARYHTSREARDPKFRVLTASSINKSVLEAQYAVRGAIPLRAEELREELEAKGKDAELPFDEIVSCNIGNPQQLDQKPLTFLRQVSSTLLPSQGRPRSGASGSTLRPLPVPVARTQCTLLTPCSHPHAHRSPPSPSTRT